MGSVLGGHHVLKGQARGYVLNGECARGTLGGHHVLNGQCPRGTPRIKSVLGGHQY